MIQNKEELTGRRSTGPANRFSQLLNEELRAAQSQAFDVGHWKEAYWG